MRDKPKTMDKMKQNFLTLLLIPLVLTASHAYALAQNSTLAVDMSQPAAKMSPLHYGLMTEEISYSYDGGLYAELVRNRAFLDNPQTPVHWSVVQGKGSEAAISLDRNQPLNAALTTSLHLDVTSASPTAPAGVANSGYWGIPVKPDTRYRATVYAKAAAEFNGPFSLTIESADGATVYATASVPHLTGDWKEYTLTIKTGKVAPTSNARLALTVDRPGTVWLGFVSLFPPTWKNQPNGFRPDLMQMLVDLKPAFLRFPGGNYLEGNTIATRFDWNRTLSAMMHSTPLALRAIQMFSGNHGDTLPKTTQTGAPLLSSISRDSKTGAIFIKNVNPQATPQEVHFDLKGVRSVAPMATMLLLAADPAATNAIDEPTKVVPITRQVSDIGLSFTHLPALFDHHPSPGYH